MPTVHNGICKASASRKNCLATFEVIAWPPEQRGSALWKKRILSACQNRGKKWGKISNLLNKNSSIPITYRISRNPTRSANIF